MSEYKVPQRVSAIVFDDVGSDSVPFPGGNNVAVKADSSGLHLMEADGTTGRIYDTLSYADYATMAAATGFTAADVGREARKLDDGTTWERTATGWRPATTELYPEEYGASPGGSASVNTSAINAAITASVASGKPLVFSAGTYEFDGTLVCSGTAGLTLKGRGRASRLKFTGSGAKATVTGAGASFATLTNGETLTLSLDGRPNVVITFLTGDDTLADAVYRINDTMLFPVASASAGQLRLRSANAGIGSSIQVVAGSTGLLAKLGLTAGTYSGTGVGRAIDARSSLDFEIRDMQIGFANTFSGTVVDVSGTDAVPSYYVKLSHVVMSGDSAVGTLLMCHTGHSHSFERCDFYVCDTVAVGMIGSGQWANVVEFVNCRTGAGYTATRHILNPGKSWKFSKCTFEALIGGVANSIECWARCTALSIVNACQFDDASSGTWCTIRGQGITIQGNTFLGANAVAFGYATIGATVKGNHFDTLTTALTFDYNCVSIDAAPNSFTAVTNMYVFPAVDPSKGALPIGFFPSYVYGTWTGAGTVQMTPYHAASRNSADQSIPNDVFTRVEMHVALDDPNGLISYEGIFTAPATGRYQVNGVAGVQITSGFCACNLSYGSGGYVRGSTCPAFPGSYPVCSVASVVHLNYGQTLELQVLQKSGSPATTYTATLDVHLLSGG